MSSRFSTLVFLACISQLEAGMVEEALAPSFPAATPTLAFGSDPFVVHSGIYGINTLKDADPEFRSLYKGLHYRVGWDTLEQFEGNFSWRALDDTLEIAATSDPPLDVLLQVDTGDRAPQWIFNEGVRVVEVSKDGETTKWPYYLDGNYTTFFTAMHAAVRVHLAELEPRLRARV